MSVTLKNYRSVLPKELIQLAEKNKVRECDETEKGHFIAYVDEGDESFDVSLNILPGGEISGDSCDCKNGASFCRHKAALLIHVANGKKIKTTIKAKKKESKAESLLDDAEPGELREWLRTLLQKNKDIELSFIHHFSGKRQQYTVDEVRKLVNDAIKVVVGNKRSVDLTQLKKLVELWAEMLEPIVRNYQANVMDEQSFLNFQALLEGCNAFQLKVNSSSNKIQKYVEDLLQASVGTINNLYEEEAWDKATGYFIGQVPIEQNPMRMQYLQHLKNVADTSSDERKRKMIDLLARQLKKSNVVDTVNGTVWIKIVFGMIEENNLFPKYYQLFKPLRFDNGFNIRLINLLVENQQLELAEKFCREQINANYQEEFSIPYLEILKKIYILQKNIENLAKVLEVLFPYSYDFQDYLLITERMPEEERKKWRTKILSRAKNASNNNNRNAGSFCFKLMDHEKSYRKMIDYIDSHTPYDIIYQYFEPMALTDKARLLEALIRRSDEDLWMAPGRAGTDDACFPELYELCKKYFPTNHLKLAINSADKGRFYFRLNRFMSYVKERIT